MTSLRNQLSEKNNYYIPKFRRLELNNFCRQYPDWKKAYSQLDGYSKANVEFISCSEHGDPTAKCAIKREEYLEKILMVEKAAKDADESIAKYILESAITGKSYGSINMKHRIPCCEHVFYRILHKFFWILDKYRD